MDAQRLFPQRRNVQGRCLLSRRVPERHLLSYVSPGSAYTVPGSAWVTGKFSPLDDSILFLGGDTGRVGIMDVTDSSKPSAMLHNWNGHTGVVMDIVGVPSERGKVLTLSGYDVRIWHVNSQPRKSDLFKGHNSSLRCAAFVPNDPHIFCTGGRDGRVVFWDRRLVMNRRNGIEFRMPKEEFKNVHLKPGPILSSTPGTPSMSLGRKAGRTFTKPAPSITCMAFVDDNLLLTGSSDCRSGIRLWDRRKMTQPLLAYTLPTRTHRETGIASISLDRFHSSLFAASTDNSIYELAIGSKQLNHVRSYEGAQLAGDYYTQVACSPVSDHVLCGSNDGRALVWDVQAYHSYMDSPIVRSPLDSSIRPSFSLGGHGSKVATVGWSCKGTYMMSMDDTNFRVWFRPPPSSKSILDAQEELGMQFEQIERVETPKVERAVADMEREMRALSSPTKNCGMGKKRKDPFTSPEKENAPRTKKRKLFEKEETKKTKLPPNPFYYKDCCDRLPDFVQARFLEKREKEKRARDNKEAPLEEKTASDRKERPTMETWLRSGGTGGSKPRKLAIIQGNGNGGTQEALTETKKSRRSLLHYFPTSTSPRRRK